jgi:hypothetical protein
VVVDTLVDLEAVAFAVAEVAAGLIATLTVAASVVGGAAREAAFGEAETARAVAAFNSGNLLLGHSFLFTKLYLALELSKIVGGEAGSSFHRLVLLEFLSELLLNA